MNLQACCPGGNSICFYTGCSRETVILEAKGAEIFLYRGQSWGQCVLKYLQTVRLGLLTKSILDGCSGSNLSGLNFWDNECCYCSKLGAIGGDW